jgi:hypothetical protein
MRSRSCRASSELGEAEVAGLDPGEELLHGPQIRHPRVHVPDGGGKELGELLLGAGAGPADDGRDNGPGVEPYHLLGLIDDDDRAGHGVPFGWAARFARWRASEAFRMVSLM